MAPLCISKGSDFSDNKLNPEFVKELAQILDSLDKSYLYKLEYSLFLHTNDSNKKVEFFHPPFSGIVGDDLSDFFQKITYECNKFHGYLVFKSDRIDLKDYDFSNYSSDVLNNLAAHVASINEDLI